VACGPTRAATRSGGRERGLAPRDKARPRGAAVRISHGTAARWGHGVLPPPPDPAELRAGIATISGHDPGFRARALTEWATEASALIGQSLVSGDAVPPRTFMSNGLYRTHLALLQLRAEGDMSCSGSWQAVQAFVVTPAAGGLPASRCPSCGAGLDLDPDGACRYCHGIVTAGSHDWVLLSWQRKPW
jgi:hypothetical protein